MQLVSSPLLRRLIDRLSLSLPFSSVSVLVANERQSVSFVHLLQLGNWIDCEGCSLSIYKLLVLHQSLVKCLSFKTQSVTKYTPREQSEFNSSGQLLSFHLSLSLSLSLPLSPILSLSLPLSLSVFLDFVFPFARTADEWTFTPNERLMEAEASRGDERGERETIVERVSEWVNETKRANDEREEETILQAAWT